MYHVRHKESKVDSSLEKKSASIHMFTNISVLIFVGNLDFLLIHLS